MCIKAQFAHLFECESLAGTVKVKQKEQNAIEFNQILFLDSDKLQPKLSQGIYRVEQV